MNAYYVYYIYFVYIQCIHFIYTYSIKTMYVYNSYIFYIHIENIYLLIDLLLILQVEGCLTVQNPTVPPFKRICAICRVQNVVLVSGGKYYCKKCECNQEVEFLPFIKVKILEANARDVQVSVEGEWLSALVRMPVVEFLKLGRREQIKLLSQLRLHGRFNLTPTSYLAGYEEYYLDAQGDVKESGQSQSTPAESTPISELSTPSLDLEPENTPPTLSSREGVKRRLSDKLDSVKKSKK